MGGGRPGLGASLGPPREATRASLATSASHVLHLCVMTSPKRRADRVGIRELRQNLSVYIKGVREEGRTYEVTEHGEPVARLVPLEGSSLPTWDRLIAQGKITPAAAPWSSLPPPLPRLPGKSLSEILQEMRDEDER